MTSMARCSSQFLELNVEFGILLAEFSAPKSHLFTNKQTVECCSNLFQQPIACHKTLLKSSKAAQAASTTCMQEKMTLPSMLVLVGTLQVCKKQSQELPNLAKSDHDTVLPAGGVGCAQKAGVLCNSGSAFGCRARPPGRRQARPPGPHKRPAWPGAAINF